LFASKAYTNGNSLSWYRPSSMNTYVKIPGL
jgi:hypothetical protein